MASESIEDKRRPQVHVSSKFRDHSNLNGNSSDEIYIAKVPKPEPFDNRKNDFRFLDAWTIYFSGD
jgi:hypothetical protein